MIILGIDPGTQYFGFAVLRCQRSQVELCDYDSINLKKGHDILGMRLEKLYEVVVAKVREWNPHFIGVEKAVTFKNVASAHTLSEARGVIRLALFQNLEKVDQRLIELSPTYVKRCAGGFGQSSKEGIKKTMSLRFQSSELEKKTLSFDAFDAMAVAWSTWVRVKNQTMHDAKKFSEVQS